MASVRPTNWSRRASSSRRVPAVRERPGRRLVAAGRRAVRPPHRGVVHVLAELEPRVQAPDQDDRPDRCHRRPGRRALLLDLVQHGARMGLRVRRGPRGGSERLDHTARPERPHDAGRRLELSVGLDGGAAQPSPPLPDVQPGGRGLVHTHRHHRRVARGVRQLRRLAGVEHRPVPLGGQAGGDRHRVRHRLGHADRAGRVG